MCSNGRSNVPSQSTARKSGKSNIEYRETTATVSEDIPKMDIEDRHKEVMKSTT